MIITYTFFILWFFSISDILQLRNSNLFPERNTYNRSTQHVIHLKFKKSMYNVHNLTVGGFKYF